MAEQLTFTERLDNISNELDTVLSESNIQLEAKGVEAVDALDDLPDAIAEIQTGGGGETSWSQVRNKPFSTVGAGLNVVDDELIADGSGGSSDWSDVTNKPFESIGTGLKVESGVLKTTGGSGGQRGADWEAEEDEDGYIENKPFYEAISDLPGLPKKYIDNFSMSFANDEIDDLGISPEQWESATGVSRENSFCNHGFIMNHDQLVEFWEAFMGGEPYPGDEAIIEEYGSIQGFIDEYLEPVSEMYNFPKITYIGDFSYTTGQIPDYSSLLNPESSAFINDITVSVPPTRIDIGTVPSSALPAEADPIDVWGNTGLFNNLLTEIFEGLSICKDISNINSADYYFAITRIIFSIGGIFFNFYWYDLALANKNYFEKTPVSHTETYITKKSTDEGTTITTSTSDVTHTERFDIVDAHQKVSVAYTINASTDDNLDVTFTNISGSVGMYDCKFKFILDGNKIFEIVHKNQYIDELDDFDFNLVQGEHTFIIELEYSELSMGGDPEAYFSANIIPQSGTAIEYTEEDSVDVEITTYSFVSTFDYTLTSAKANIIHYLNDKFIEKPEWWFGEKKIIISEPTSIYSYIVAGIL